MSKDKNERPESYPRPSTTDQQLKNQPEFIDQQPNDFSDKSVSDTSGQPAERQVSDPSRETGED